MNKTFTRRQLFSTNTLIEILNKNPKEAKIVGLDQYFKSPLHSYAFVQDLPWEIILDEANKLGISCVNRSKSEIVHDILKVGIEQNGL